MTNCAIGYIHSSLHDLWYWISVQETTFTHFMHIYCDSLVCIFGKATINKDRRLSSTINITRNDWIHALNIDHLVQDCNDSTADALELLQPCTKPSIYCHIWRQLASTRLLWHLYNSWGGLSFVPQRGRGRVLWQESCPALNMMTSSNKTIFCVTGPLRGESTGHRWIPFTTAHDPDLWWCIWSEGLSNQSRCRWF